jgi:hypothetical protein
MAKLTGSADIWPHDLVRPARRDPADIREGNKPRETAPRGFDPGEGGGGSVSIRSNRLTPEDIRPAQWTPRAVRSVEFLCGARPRGSLLRNEGRLEQLLGGARDPFVGMNCRWRESGSTRSPGHLVASGAYRHTSNVISASARWQGCRSNLWATPSRFLRDVAKTGTEGSARFVIRARAVSPPCMYRFTTPAPL